MTIKLRGRYVFGAIAFQDNKSLYFGSADDVSFKWNGSVLQILPVTDDTGAFNVGNGTYDMDSKFFLGSTGKYVLFDVGNARVDFGSNANGIDIRIFGATTNHRVWWDPDGDSNGTWYFGYDDYGFDVAFYGQAIGVSMLWDASAAELTIDGADIRLKDGDELRFGDAAGGDATLSWDGSALNIAGVTVVTTESIRFNDGKSAHFGTGSDFSIRESSGEFLFSNATSDTQMTFGVSAAGMKYLFYMKTSGYWIKFDDGVITLSESYMSFSGSRGIAIIIGGSQTSGIRFGTSVTNAFEFGAGGPYVSDAGHTHNTAAGEILITYDGSDRWMRTWKT